MCRICTICWAGHNGNAQLMAALPVTTVLGSSPLTTIGNARAPSAYHSPLVHNLFLALYVDRQKNENLWDLTVTHLCVVRRSCINVYNRTERVTETIKLGKSYNTYGGYVSYVRVCNDGITAVMRINMSMITIIRGKNYLCLR